MEKRKMIFISVVSVIIAILITMSTLTVLTYFGVVDIPLIKAAIEPLGINTHKGIDSKNANIAFKNELNEILDNTYYTYLKAENGEKIHSINGGDFQKTVVSNIKYKIKSKDISKNNATFKVEFTYPDIISTELEYYKKGRSNNFKTDITTKLEDVAVIATKEIELKMIKDSDKWYLVVSDEFYDILSGGLKSFIEQYNEEMIEYWEEQANA